MRSDPRLIGREAELHAIDAALAAIAAGEPRGLEILGAAGMGKTRLLAELGARSEALGQLVLAGAGAELERDMPFWFSAAARDGSVGGVAPRRLQRLDPVLRAELGHVLPSQTSGEGSPGGLHERYRTHRRRARAARGAGRAGAAGAGPRRLPLGRPG